jgi:magnesium transporter
MKQTVSTVLVNPPNEQIAEHIGIFEKTSITKFDVHRVARTNLLQCIRNFTDPFPRMESHGHYLFGEFAVPTSLVDGIDLFITVQLIADFKQVLLVVRTPPDAELTAESNEFISGLMQIESGLASSGEYIVKVISQVVLELERNIEEVHKAVDDDLRTVNSTYFDLKTELLNSLNTKNLYSAASRYRIDILGVKSSIDQTHRVLTGIATDKIDLKLEDNSESVQFFPQSLEIDVSDLVIRIRHLRSLRDNLETTLTITFKKFEKIENAKQTKASHTMTAIASIMLLPTFIVGLFGQNFRFTKEIEYHWGWPISVAVIVIVTCGQVFFFKRKKWL